MCLMYGLNTLKIGLATMIECDKVGGIGCGHARHFRWRWIPQLVPQFWWDHGSIPNIPREFPWPFCHITRLGVLFNTAIHPIFVMGKSSPKQEEKERFWMFDCLKVNFRLALWDMLQKKQLQWFYKATSCQTGWRFVAPLKIWRCSIQIMNEYVSRNISHGPSWEFHGTASDWLVSTVQQNAGIIMNYLHIFEPCMALDIWVFVVS